MTIKELKELIKDLPDEMEVGATDHFGSFVEVDANDFWLDTYKSVNQFRLRPDKTFFHIPAVNIGDEPD